MQNLNLFILYPRTKRNEMNSWFYSIFESIKSIKRKEYRLILFFVQTAICTNKCFGFKKTNYNVTI